DGEWGREASRLGADWEPGGRVAFSRDGKRLAVGGSGDGGRRRGAVTIWDWEGRRRLVTLHGHSGDINALAFAPGGSWLASADSAGIVKIWDVAAGRER